MMDDNQAYDEGQVLSFHKFTLEPVNGGSNGGNVNGGSNGGNKNSNHGSFNGGKARIGGSRRRRKWRPQQQQHPQQSVQLEEDDQMVTFNKIQVEGIMARWCMLLIWTTGALCKMLSKY